MPPDTHTTMSKSDVINAYVKEHAVEDISEEEALKIIKQVIKSNPKAVEDYKAGKQRRSKALLVFSKYLEHTNYLNPVFSLYFKALFGKN